MKYIFLDTNIFIHYKNFEEIDWLNEASCSDCTLVIAPIVLNELDKKKIGTNKISNKVRKILTRFEEIIEFEITAIKDKVSINILSISPPKSIYENNDLNFDEQDDRLIASIIHFISTQDYYCKLALDT